MTRTRDAVHKDGAVVTGEQLPAAKTRGARPAPRAADDADSPLRWPRIKLPPKLARAIVEDPEFSLRGG